MSGPWASQRGIAQVTWAELMALNPAAYSPSQLFYVANLGLGGSYWFSNGTLWRPVNGSIVMASDEIGNISTTQTVIGNVAGWGLTVPSGLLARVGAKLRTMVRASRSGMVAGTCILSVANDSASTHPLAHVSSTSTTASTLQALGVVSRNSSTQLRHSSSYGASWSGSNNATMAEANIGDVDMNLVLRANVAGVGETITFKDLLVECFP